MGERRGTKALELWCKRMTEGYAGVKVENMTTSWRDGLAFCAMIHHFRPDLIDFASLNKDDIYRNNELAFRVAERHLGIPALLDAEDMVEYSVPDRLSILTYLSQFYQVFGVTQGSSSSRMIGKRSATVADRGIVSPTSSSPPTKAIRGGGVGISRREPCVKCGLPVFLAERLHVNNQLYHRTCFRCARCSTQLSLANYYETEDGQFCCETCPDEVAMTSHDQADYFDKQKVLTRSLSDEEKQKGLQRFEEKDKFSASFESALDNITKSSSAFSKARSSFMTTQLIPDDAQQGPSSVSADTDDSDSDGILTDPDKAPPDLPSSKPPDQLRDTDRISLTSIPTFSTTDTCDVAHRNDARTDEILDDNVNTRVAQITSAAHDLPVHKLSSDKCSDSIDQPLTASDPPLASNDSDFEENVFVTKEANTVTIDETLQPTRQSFVQLRMQMFESNNASADLFKNPSRTQSTNETQSPVEKTSFETANLNKIEIICDENVTVRSDISSSNHVEILDSSSADYARALAVDTLAKISQLTPLTETNIENIETPPVSNSKNIENTEITSSSNLPEAKTNESIANLTGTNEYPEELNPFDDDDNDEIPSNVIPPSVQKSKHESTNPFGSSSDEADHINKTFPVPSSRQFSKTLPTKRLIKAPKVSLNPFSSDDDSSDNESKQQAYPIPKPRSRTDVISSTLEPNPRTRRLEDNTYRTYYGSSTSLSSVTSSVTHTPSGTSRKKKLAPPPPSIRDLFPHETRSLNTSLLSISDPAKPRSPQVTPKARKNRKAPAPPTSTPAENTITLDVTISPIFESITSDVSADGNNIEITTSPAKSTGSNEWEIEKITKDEQNRNRQSMTISLNNTINTSENATVTPPLSAPNKSTFGKWKRKKGPAPARPMPQRRQIKSLPTMELHRQLDDIEVQQQGLEKQGVKLEQLIREKCEIPGVEESSISIEVEDLILQLFELVNEKNELFRKQAELMYLRRQQRLEEEHADLEYQIRCLMDQPERNKTDSDKAKEEELINRLIEIVERRNEIVECLEMDRIREAEEDQSIHTQLNRLAAKRDESNTSSPQTPTKLSKKERKKLKKEKKLKANVGRDADKDVDETEVIGREGKKKKWFLHI